MKKKDFDFDFLNWVKPLEETVRKYTCYLTGVYDKILKQRCSLCEETEKLVQNYKLLSACDCCIHSVMIGKCCQEQRTYREVAHLENHGYIVINKLSNKKQFEKKMNISKPSHEGIIQARVDFLKDMIARIKKTGIYSVAMGVEFEVDALD